MITLDTSRKSRHNAGMSKKIVSTAAQAIEVLGGREFVGDWWGVGRTGMLDMIRRGRISAGYRLHAFKALESMGYQAAPQVFGLKNWDNLKPPLRLRRRIMHASRSNGATRLAS